MPRSVRVRPKHKKIHRQAPETWLHDGTLGEDFFRYIGVPKTYHDGPGEIVRYRDVYLDAESKVCLDATGQVITDNMLLPRYEPRVVTWVAAMRAAIAAGHVTVLDRAGPLALLATPYHANYYHFLCDDLGRLGFYEAADLLRKVLLPVPRPKPWQRELYSLAGISERLVLLPNGVSRLPEVWVAPRGLTYQIAELRSRAIRRVRAIGMQVAVEEARTAGSRQIFISREGARHRRLRNEAEVQQVVREAGFTVLRPELMSVVEQIRAFKDADVVLGVFGAGLTNALFMRPGCLLLEIAPAHTEERRGIHNAIFSTVAGIGKLRYGLLSAPAATVDADTHDFIVPLPWLKTLLHRL